MFFCAIGTKFDSEKVLALKSDKYEFLKRDNLLAVYTKEHLIQNVTIKNFKSAEIPQFSHNKEDLNLSCPYEGSVYFLFKNKEYALFADQIELLRPFGSEGDNAYSMTPGLWLTNKETLKTLKFRHHIPDWDKIEYPVTPYSRLFNCDSIDEYFEVIREILRENNVEDTKIIYYNDPYFKMKDRVAAHFIWDNGLEPKIQHKALVFNMHWLQHTLTDLAMTGVHEIAHAIHKSKPDHKKEDAHGPEFLEICTRLGSPNPKITRSSDASFKVLKPYLKKNKLNKIYLPLHAKNGFANQEDHIKAYEVLNN